MIKLPSISANEEFSKGSIHDTIGVKRLICDMSQFKFGFRDVLEPAKKQKKMELQA